MPDHYASFVGQLYLAEPQSFRNLTVVPLLTPEDQGPPMLTLGEALAAGALTITEVVEGGTVPELRVINRAALPVLLLDGEELAGAKQNRALNTTLLLPATSETIIPVSCTEHGRWNYTSHEFSESGNVLPSKMRTSKHAAVRASLARERSFRSDQGRVWSEVDELREQTGTSSPTGAMQDVYRTRAEDLQAYLNAITCLPRQVGLLVYIDGRTIGYDAFAQSAVYERLQPKLIKSYALDALVTRGQPGPSPSMERAERFLAETVRSKGTLYPSVGCGEDHRLLGQRVVGSVLVVEEIVVHAACFRTTGTTETGSIPSARSRRGFRS